MGGGGEFLDDRVLLGLRAGVLSFSAVLLLVLKLKYMQRRV